MENEVMNNVEVVETANEAVVEAVKTSSIKSVVRDGAVLTVAGVVTTLASYGILTAIACANKAAKSMLKKHRERKAEKKAKKAEIVNE